MSKIRMMTMVVRIRLPMFDRPLREMNRKILVAAMRECDRKELEGHIVAWHKEAFLREDL